MGTIEIDTTDAENALEALHSLIPLLGRQALRMDGDGRNELAEMADEMGRSATAIQEALAPVDAPESDDLRALSVLQAMGGTVPRHPVPWRKLEKCLEPHVENPGRLVGKLGVMGLVEILVTDLDGKRILLTDKGLAALGAL